MAHIFLLTSGLTGILYASFKIVKTLEAAGHRVTYATPKTVGEMVRTNGITYQQLPITNFDPTPTIPNFQGNSIQRLLYKFRHQKRLQQKGIANLRMDEFEAILKEISPDLVLVDVELHEQLMTCVALDYPTILLSQWYSLWERKGLPPLQEETIPGEGFRGSRLGLKLAWTKIKLKRWWMFAKQKWRSAGTDRRSLLKEYARQIGFPLQYTQQNFWPGPFTYNGLPIFSMTMAEMDFPHPKQSELQYIGAQVYTARKQTKVNTEIDAQLDTIFQQKQQGKSLIYCSVSTFKSGDEQFLQKVIQAFKDQPKWLLIIGLGGMVESEYFQNLPDNVFAFSWIPQLKVLAEADLSINHGGVHTINECIHFQVPMLVYSGKRSDQNGCAARVHYRDIGMMADKDVDDSIAIAQKIAAILNDDRYQQRLQEMNADYQDYETDQVLTQKINQYLAFYKAD
ncbi:MAG: nucleotide disphospho-sugar-binding domain-containing protein [Bacteroidota bacterium]